MRKGPPERAEEVAGRARRGAEDDCRTGRDGGGEGAFLDLVAVVVFSMKGGHTGELHTWCRCKRVPSYHQ